MNTIESRSEMAGRRARSKSQPILPSHSERDLLVPISSKQKSGSSSDPPQHPIGAMRIVKVKSAMRVKTQSQSLIANGIVRLSEQNATRESCISKQVSFTVVHVREFNRTVGDNPSCSSGPPLSLDWTFYDTHPTSIDAYRLIHGLPKRESYDLIISREERQAILIDDWEISRVEIALAIRENHKIKNQRRRSVNNRDKSEKLDAFWESAQRKLKRTILFQKRSSLQVQDMMQQAAQAAASMKKITDEMGEDTFVLSGDDSRNGQEPKGAEDCSDNDLLNQLPTKIQVFAQSA